MVYFVLDDRTKEVKIGYSKNVQNRMKAILTNRPHVKVIKEIEGGRELEKELHHKFRAFRKEREWFSYTSEIAEFLGLDTGAKRKPNYAEQRLIAMHREISWGTVDLRNWPRNVIHEYVKEKFKNDIKDEETKKLILNEDSALLILERYLRICTAYMCTQIIDELNCVKKMYYEGIQGGIYD